MAAVSPGACEMEGLRGKRVLITGSTRGIGHASARRFLTEGASVVIHGRTQKSVERAVGELATDAKHEIIGLAADLSNGDACWDLCARCGEIDILVNCAGVWEELSIGESDEAHWHRLMDVNVTAAWRLSRGLLPALRRRQGVIVNVSSDAGLLGYANNAVYCASKGALIGLTRALAVELAPDVRALCVCPGPVDTDMMRLAVARETDASAASEPWASLTLLRRVARPEEIAGAIAFAASADCSFATGNLIVVDGGATTGKRPFAAPPSAV